VRRMCRVMNVHHSGYYAWRTSPTSARQHEDVRLLGLIKQFWLESGGVYGYRKITDDMRDMGERCGKHRVYRLMKEGLRSQNGYRRRPGARYSRPSIAGTTSICWFIFNRFAKLFMIKDIRNTFLMPTEFIKIDIFRRLKNISQKPCFYYI